MKSKNYFNLFLGLACASVLMMSSCSKETPTGAYAPASSAQDKETLKEASNALGDAAGEIVASPGVGAVASFSSVIPKGTGKTDGFLRTQIMNRLISLGKISKGPFVKKGASNKTASEEPEAGLGQVSFDFDGNTGTYNYDPTGGDEGNGGFSYSKGGTKIVINFPADTANKNNNNGTLTISSFSEVKLADSLFMPTSMLADLKVNGNVMARLTFSASYSSNGLPEELSFVLWVKPFTLAINLSNQSTTSKGSLSLIEDGKSQPIIAFGATVEFTNSSKESVSSVTDAYFQVKGLRIAGNVNVAAIGEDATEQQLNDNVDIAISVDGSEVGELVFVKSSSTEAYIKFSDGSKEPAETYLDMITAMGEEETSK